VCQPADRVNALIDSASVLQTQFALIVPARVNFHMALIALATVLRDRERVLKGALK
jgi:hypothetical protein